MNVKAIRYIGITPIKYMQIVLYASVPEYPPLSHRVYPRPA